MSETPITNANASDDIPSNYEICMRSGRKCKRGTLVREKQSNLWVHPDYEEKVHPQEMVRSKPENQRGAKRPEPVDNPTFVEALYPNGVSASDL